MLNNFYKKNESDQIWWVDDPETIGVPRFSFDKKKIYYLYRDYPQALSPEELLIFNKENPFWKNFFKR